MIVTVTLNPALDKTLTLPGFAVNTVNRVQSIRLDPGGKGINVSKCLRALGADTVAAAILAGSAGKQLEDMLKALNIPVLQVNVPGQSRTNLKIIDPVKKENTDINEPGPKVMPEDLEALRLMLGSKVKKGDSIVLSGSLPAGVEADLYRVWTTYFRELGAAVFLDADGEPMALGIQAGPYMIKPNNHELARLLGKEKLSLEEMCSEGKHLVESGIREVVISLGGDGALFVSNEGVFHAEGLSVPVKSTVGAGDSMVAAMVYSKEKGLDRETAIRLAVAMGAASVMQDGSQSPEKELVEKLAQNVKLKKLSF